MKKVLGIILWSLIGIIIIGYISLFVAYNAYKPDKIEIGIVEQATNHFNDSYEDCRSAFLSEVSTLKQEFSDVEISSIAVPSKKNEELYVDIAYIPARDTSLNLLILTSGIHGIEGFTGSAIQLMTIRELLSPDLLSKTGILFVHGLNPFGFKNNRRVSENNIDLNRNCAIDLSLYNEVNEGYGKLYSMLNPKKKADHANSRNRNYHLISIQKIVAESMPVLRQAVLQGQYEYPEGLYFGGKALEPQFQSLKPKLKNLIDWGDSDDFYTILGSFFEWVGSLGDNQIYYPMVFEFGTLDSQKTLGSIRSLHNMILENQGYHYGYRNDRTKEKIEDQFREMYYPSSPEWRTKVILDSKEILEKVFKRLGD